MALDVQEATEAQGEEEDTKKKKEITAFDRIFEFVIYNFLLKSGIY